MKLLSVGSFKDNPADPSSHSWPWPPYCQQPRTLSFRYGGSGCGVSSVSKLEPSEPRRRRPTEVEEEDSGLSLLDDDVAIETAVIAARSERRIFFKPDETSSILARGEGAESVTHEPFIEESVSVSMDSRDPYMDFRRSMGEMAAAHSLKGKSDRLEELLRWYLKANDKDNHGYIFAAFVDLLVTVQASGADCSSAADVLPAPRNNLIQSPSSPLSFYTSTSNSCCSSSTSCHVSVAESTEESSGSSSENTVAAAAPPSSLPLNVAEPTGDDNLSLSSFSSSVDVSD